MRWDFKRKKLRIQKSTVPVYRNPMFPRYNWKEKILKKGNFFCLLIISILAGLIYLFFYSPIFNITKIEITGLQNIPRDVLEEKIIKWQLSQRRFLIFKQDNLFLFSKSWLRKNIENKYALDELKVSKKLFHTLKVNVKEKLPKLIWITNSQYYYLETNGIVSAVADKEKLIQNLPSVFDAGNNDITVGEVVISDKIVDFIDKLNDKIKQETKIIITNYVFPERKSTQVNAITNEGWAIYFEANNDLDSQVINLNEGLAKKIKDTKNLEYIDLRVEGRVYYKNK